MPGMPLNHRAKFDAACFILAGEIRNRTNAHKTINKQKTVTADDPSTSNKNFANAGPVASELRSFGCLLETRLVNGRVCTEVVGAHR